MDAMLAYKAMVRFLERYYTLTNSEDVGALLGSMSMDVFQDGKSADPAIWEDWLRAIEEVDAGQEHRSDRSEPR
jgi:hypothetical protein